MGELLGGRAAHVRACAVAIALLSLLSGCAGETAGPGGRIQEFMTTQRWDPRAEVACSGASPVFARAPYAEGLVVAADSNVSELQEIAGEVEIRSDWDEPLQFIDDPATYIAICVHDVSGQRARGFPYDYMVTWATEVDLSDEAPEYANFRVLLTFFERE